MRTCSKARPAAEHGEGRREGHLPAGGQAGGDAHHVAARRCRSRKSARGIVFLKMPVLVASARSASSTTMSGFVSARAQRASPKLSRVAFFTISAILQHLQVLARVPSWQPRTPRCWGPCRASPAWPSIKETPLPFAVLAMMAKGLPLQARAAAKAFSSSSKSLPSTVMASKAEGLELRLEGRGACPRLSHAAVDLQAVVVHDHAEVVQLVVPSEHGRPPHTWPSSLSPSPSKGVHPVILVVQLSRPRAMPTAAEMPWPREPELMSTPGGALHVRMALEHGADVAQLLQLADVEIAPGWPGRRTGRGRSGPWRAQSGPGPGPWGSLGVDVHLFEVQVGEDLRRGEGASRMAGLGAIHAFDDAEAYLSPRRPEGPSVLERS